MGFGVGAKPRPLTDPSLWPGPPAQRAKGMECQEAGGGALRGIHGLQRGPIGARKRRAGARSVTR